MNANNERSASEIARAIVQEMIFRPHQSTTTVELAITNAIMAEREKKLSIVTKLKEQVRDLNDQIGYLPDGVHPDERNPRAATWLAERANWQSELAQLRERVKELEGKK